MGKKLNILSLPTEIQVEFLLYLSHIDIINYLLTCRLTYSLLKDNYLWKKRLGKHSKPNLKINVPYDDKKYGIGWLAPRQISITLNFTLDDFLLTEIFDLTNIPPYIRYRDVVQYYFGNVIDNISVCLLYNIIVDAITNNDLSIAKTLIKIYPFNLNNDEIFTYHKIFLLRRALEFSNLNMVKYIIEVSRPTQEEYEQIFIKCSRSRLILQKRNFEGCNLETCDDSIEERADYYISNNKNNYEIIEYLLTNIKFNYNNLYSILEILLSFRFSKKRFQKILTLGIFNVNTIIFKLLSGFFIIRKSKVIRIWEDGHYLLSIDFINWLLNNYQFTPKTIKKLTKIFPYRSFKGNITLTPKLDVKYCSMDHYSMDYY